MVIGRADGRADFHIRVHLMLGTYAPTSRIYGMEAGKIGSESHVPSVWSSS